jgi:2-aminoethylphosphonate-pyruvate transaminase
MAHVAREPYLLTPGPLTTSSTVKRAMLRDWGSRDREFIALNARIGDRLVRLAGGEGTHVCVPLQGSGTFVVEAMLGTLLPGDGRLLVLVNGAYGARMVKMARYHGRQVAILETPEDQPNDVAALERALAADPTITHVAAVHCETTSGILNPIERIAEVTAAATRRLLIDAMSAFGALPLDAREVPFDAAAASANKCLEGCPVSASRSCATRRFGRPRATRLLCPSICTISMSAWSAAGSGGLRRRPTCSPRSIRRSMSMRRRAASRVAARVIVKTAAS